MRVLQSIALFTVLVLLPGWCLAAEVAQGKCLSFEPGVSLTMEEYDTNFETSKYGNPTGIESTFNISKAEIGILPNEGDIIRLAYQLNGDEKIALKVMNVSRQDLMKK